MAIAFSTYYNFVRVRELGPEAKDWAVTDTNYEAIALLLKSFEQHSHTGAAGLVAPVASTTVASGSNGVNVSTFTGSGVLSVASVSAFSGYTTTGGTLYVTTSDGTRAATITFTGISGSTFTGCTLTAGSGTLSTGGEVDVGIPNLIVSSTGGSLTPGTTVGVRLSYLNTLGLETDATLELDTTTSVAITPPLTPILSSVNPFVGGLMGGTYIYGYTKTVGAGETELSDVLPVQIDYDQTYSVTITFDAINTLTDGTTGYNIYRSAGLNSQFQLVGQISDVTALSFVDTNTAIDATAQPPTVSTFDSTYKVTIDWSALGAYPAAATTLNVYVTQQTGVFGTEALLDSIDLTSSPPTSLDYLGSETLGSGYPFDATQVPSQPPKIDLGTQATGGFILTTNGDFQKHQALNFVVGNSSGAPGSPANGEVYYDTSLNNIRAYINGAWTNWGIAAGSAYTHPAEEVGGHLATNIRWVSGSSSPSVDDLLDSFFDTSGNRKQDTLIQAQGGPNNAAAISTNTTPTIIDSASSFITLGPPEFNNQYYRLTWQGNVVVGGTAFQTLTLQMYLHSGSAISGTDRKLVLEVSSLGTSFPFYISTLIQVPTAGVRVDLKWVTSSGTVNGAMAINSYFLDATSLV